MKTTKRRTIEENEGNEIKHWLVAKNKYMGFQDIYLFACC